MRRESLCMDEVPSTTRIFFRLIAMARRDRKHVAGFVQAIGLRVALGTLSDLTPPTPPLQQVSG
jgi:hypothetical protein